MERDLQPREVRNLLLTSWESQSLECSEREKRNMEGTVGERVIVQRVGKACSNSLSAIIDKYFQCLIIPQNLIQYLLAQNMKQKMHDWTAHR